RELIFTILMHQPDHPTAEEIHGRAKETLSGISLATVYNGLEALVSGGLIKQVHFERASTRFCPNLKEQAHIQCERTGQVFDVPLDQEASHYLKDILPEGFSAKSISLSYVGQSTTEDSIVQNDN
ncbi:MAG: transcriptional repressor, partial [Opitutales bacterium]